MIFCPPVGRRVALVGVCDLVDEGLRDAARVGGSGGLEHAGGGRLRSIVRDAASIPAFSANAAMTCDPAGCFVHAPIVLSAVSAVVCVVFIVSFLWD